jgi:DNA polymerase III epsilon subunit-like protein
LAEIGRMSFLVRPKTTSLSAIVQKATGLTIEMLAKEKTFAHYINAVTAFFARQESICAHNLGHDIPCLAFELARLERSYKFPWPWVHYDTVELTMDLQAQRKKSDRLKLGELFELATGLKPKTAHRAMDDVETLVTCVRWLRIQGRI